MKKLTVGAIINRPQTKTSSNNSGITLIALIVTIIVLLILAGVTLSLIGGSDGILSRATNAVDKHEIATIKENVELKVAEDVERFHEEKYVDFSIDNSMTAYEYLKENTNKTIKRGNEEYKITYSDSTDTSKPDDNKIQVDYVKKGTKLSITGKITQTGVIIWDEDVQISDGNTEGSGTGGSGETGDSGETEKDIPLSISDPTWNGTNATVTVTGKKEGSTLQYRVDGSEWQDIESGTTVTFPAGTKVEACFFDGTNREIISSPKVLTLSYIVAYDGNGATAGSTENSSHEYGVAKALNSNGFEKDGFAFKGWNTAVDGTGQAYADEESVTNLSSINGATVTLFAQWEENRKLATLAISADNYGDKIAYSSGGFSDWLIFLNDGKNVTIMCQEYVPHSSYTYPSNFNTSGSYDISIQSPSALTAWMSNSAYWSNFGKGSGCLSAFGAPTSSEFILSVQQKYGYNPTNLGSASYLNDTLYVPHKFAWNGIYGAWIRGDMAGAVSASYYTMYYHHTDARRTGLGVRPIVVLKDTVRLEKNESGVWEIFDDA